MIERKKRLRKLSEYNKGLQVAIVQAEAAKEVLRQSQKMAAVGHLTGGLTHDFNNILTVIMGSLEEIKADLDDAGLGDRHGLNQLPALGNLQNHLAAAIKSTQRGAAVTQRLLAFSRHQPLSPKHLSVNLVVDGIAELLCKAVGRRIALTMALAPDAGETRCDWNQLENALLNLAINARDAMPHGGKLTITTAPVQLFAAAAAAAGLVAGRYVTLTMTDTGTGMPPALIARAFDPFFTTKPVGHGTGLGLSMIRGFAQEFGGQVLIHSVEQAGATVTIYLPQSAGPDAPDLEAQTGR
jgi:signal transduction histidine kinase